MLTTFNQMAPQIIKICGLKHPEDAQVAIDSSANLLGEILVPGRKRTVADGEALAIAKLCREERRKRHTKFQNSKQLLEYVNESKLEGPEWFEQCQKLIVENGPFLVGVFRNQSLEDVQRRSAELQVDFVQLHGSEDVTEFVHALDLPVIPRFVPGRSNIEKAVTTHMHMMPLLDSEMGGEGKLINWDDAEKFYNEFGGRFILAGGLNPENVAKALKVTGCMGVDVSGGVETDGIKDPAKIRSFIRHARDL